MGNIGAKLMRLAKTYNVGNRAQKVISKEKPTPAPSYPSTAQQIEIADQVNPNFMKTHYKQDPVFHDRLKHVYVTSNAQFASEEQRSEKLPQNKEGSQAWDYGFWEPEKAQQGKILLKDALKFMSDNTTDPEKNNAKKIAKQYKLAHKDVENILEYYRVFQIIVPPKDTHRWNLKVPSITEILGKSSEKKVSKVE
ncbi:protein NDUFAF4 homolog [Diachasma alloeum]|uniref:protein NDUFAF4 homolog n=1 Tax=Diachasma alloeum TaxID=454923 RepID=UPI0007381E09|nr:protein NDUFAF4 homolog [Diachasma alloeum]